MTDDEYDRLKAKLEQSGAFMRDVLPPQWWGLFVGCKEVGFDDDQSFRLVQTWIMTKFSDKGTRAP